MPLYPQSAASQKMCPQLLALLLFSPQIHIRIYQRPWERITLLEILSFATSHYATGMQLIVVCNYKFGIV